MSTYKIYKIRLISILLVVLMPCSQMAWAAPVLTVPIPQLDRISIDPFISNPSDLDIPFEHVTLKDFHKGTNGKLIVHIQDAHANLGGQQSLSRTLDHLMTRYDMNLVLVEGSARDSTLTPVRELAPIKDWKIIASRFLFDGIISGEEYLNLTTTHPMKIRGVEYKDIYDQSIRAYAALVDQRSDILHYLHDSKTALNRLKNKFYPKSLLAFEEKYPNHKEDADFQSKFEDLLLLATQGQVDLSSLKEVLKLKEIRKQEVNLDFVAITAEQKNVLKELENQGAKDFVKEYAKSSKVTHHNQMSQYMLISNLLNMAQSKKINPTATAQIEGYKSYLAEFAQLDLDTLLNELELMEDWTYEAILDNPDAQKIRAIDRFMGLLANAYKLQMSSKDFGLLKFNEASFKTESWLALMNQKLTEVGFFESVLPYKPELDNARDDLGKFYDLVSERDVAFIDNAKRIMAETDSKAAFLIAGGYHTEHLTQLLKEDDYSYLVLTPIVSHKTDHAKYEKLLLAHLDANQEVLNRKIVDPFMASKLAETKTPRGLRNPDFVTASEVIHSRMAARTDSIDSTLASRMSKVLDWLRATFLVQYSPQRQAFEKARAEIESGFENLTDEIEARKKALPALKDVLGYAYKQIKVYTNATDVYVFGDNHADFRQFVVDLINKGILTHPRDLIKVSYAQKLWASVKRTAPAKSSVFPTYIDGKDNFDLGVLTSELLSEYRVGIRDNPDKYLKGLNANTVIVLLGDVVDAHVIEKSKLRDPALRQKGYGSRTPNLTLLEFIRDLSKAADKRGAKVVANLGNHDDLIRRTLRLLMAEKDTLLRRSPSEQLEAAKTIANRFREQEGFVDIWQKDIEDTLEELFANPKISEDLSMPLEPVSFLEFLPGGSKAWIGDYFESLKPYLVVNNHAFTHARFGHTIWQREVDATSADTVSIHSLAEKSRSYEVSDSESASVFLQMVETSMDQGLSNGGSIYRVGDNYANEWINDREETNFREKFARAIKLVSQSDVDYFWAGHSVQTQGHDREGNVILADTGTTLAFRANREIIATASIHSRNLSSLIATAYIKGQRLPVVDTLTNTAESIVGEDGRREITVLKSEASDRARDTESKILEWIKLAAQLKYRSLEESVVVDQFWMHAQFNRTYLFQAATEYPNLSDTQDLYYRAYELYRNALLEGAWKFIKQFKKDMLKAVKQSPREGTLDLNSSSILAEQLTLAMDGKNEWLGSDVSEKYFAGEDETLDEGRFVEATKTSLALALLQSGASRLSSGSTVDNPFSEHSLLSVQRSPTAPRMTVDQDEVNRPADLVTTWNILFAYLLSQKGAESLDRQRIGHGNVRWFFGDKAIESAQDLEGLPTVFIQGHPDRWLKALSEVMKNAADGRVGDNPIDVRLSFLEDQNSFSLSVINSGEINRQELVDVAMSKKIYRDKQTGELLTESEAKSEDEEDIDWKFRKEIDYEIIDNRLALLNLSLKELISIRGLSTRGPFDSTKAGGQGRGSGIINDLSFIDSNASWDIISEGGQTQTTISSRSPDLDALERAIPQLNRALSSTIASGISSDEIKQTLEAVSLRLNSRMTQVDAQNELKVQTARLTLPNRVVEWGDISSGEQDAARLALAGALYAARIAPNETVFVGVDEKTFFKAQMSLNGAVVGQGLAVDISRSVLNPVLGGIDTTSVGPVKVAFDDNVLEQNLHEAVGEVMARLIEQMLKSGADWVRPVVNLSQNIDIPEAFEAQVQAIADVNRFLISRGVQMRAQYIVAIKGVDDKVKYVDLTDEEVSSDPRYEEARRIIFESLGEQEENYTPYGSTDESEVLNKLAQGKLHPILDLAVASGQESQVIDLLKTSFADHGSIFLTVTKLDQKEGLLISPPAASYFLQVLLSAIDLSNEDQFRLIHRIFSRLTGKNLSRSRLAGLQLGEGIDEETIRISLLKPIRSLLADLSARIKGFVNVLSSA